MQSDYRMGNLHAEDTQAMIIVGYSFTAFYTLEVSLQMYSEGAHFWTGKEVGWNIFDFAIVFVAWFEISIKVMGMDGHIDTSFLRILRFFKISRVLRMFTAVRMFKEIRIMVDSLCGCFSIFIFCTIILSIFLSIFAIFFVQGATSFLESSTNVPPETVERLEANFGSV